ncbi:hypothetical protein AUC70_05660 [Methyloceanibacter stevinii]|uniref:Uncharacterized protein n=1 Tax=Methyloceanibacter stevinii TaxID=1774970 RepID=A0A1E3VNT4_9HYPH|nr:hypothetical protein AUC70_05660 [Methyloceanibacter stevinii]
MQRVKNLESKYSTLQDVDLTDTGPTQDELAKTYVSGDFGMNARFSFRMETPLKALKQWLHRLLVQ